MFGVNIIEIQEKMRTFGRKVKEIGVLAKSDLNILARTIKTRNSFRNLLAKCRFVVRYSEIVNTE